MYKQNNDFKWSIQIPNFLTDEKCDELVEQIKSQDLFFLKSSEIENILNQYNLIEKYKIFKKYPSTLEVKIQKAEPLAFLFKDAQYFSLGSIGKLIASKEAIKNIPIIFGDFEIRDFFKLKNFIDESNFNYQQITELFYFQSGRWDIKIKSGILIKLSSEHENLYVFDSLDVMCPNSECKYTSEGKSFYSDIHHLSNYSVR